MTAEQTAETLKSMKRSVEILRAVARNCQDLEAADDINFECRKLEGQIAALEGTPKAAVRLAA